MNRGFGMNVSGMLAVALICAAAGACWSDPSGDLQRGNQLLTSGDYLGAIQAFQSAVSGEPAVAGQARMGLGTCYQYLKNYDKAEAVFREVIDSKPKDRNLLSEANQALGITYEAEGKLDSAIAQWKSCINQFPKSKGPAGFHLGVCYQTQGKFPEAVSALKSVISSTGASESAGLVEARLTLGNTYRMSGDYQAAISEYQSGIRVSPKDGRLYFGVAICYQMQRNYAETINALKRALEFAPKDDAAFVSETEFTIAHIYEVARDFDTAVSLYKAYMRKSPEDGRAIYSLAACYIEQKKVREAIDLLEPVVATTQKNSKFHETTVFTLGVAYLKNEDYKKSISTFQKYDEEFPEYRWRGEFYQGLCYQAMRNLPEAMSALNKALSAAPKDDRAFVVEAKDAIAITHLLNGDVKLAMEQYKELVKEYPEQSKRWLGRLETFGVSGQAGVVYKGMMDDFKDIRPQ